MIASTSLHHVDDPAAVIDRLATTLADDGTLVVVEWAWETFDEATAHWCFQRLGQDDENWLHRLRDEWTSSGQEWQRFLEDWANGDGLHRSEKLLELLDEQFERRHLAFGPYFFPDHADTTDAEERAAIGGGLIQSNEDRLGRRAPLRDSPALVGTRTARWTRRVGRSCRRAGIRGRGGARV